MATAQTNEIQFPGGAGFYFYYNVHTDIETHRVPYLMVTRGSFFGGKLA
jgi:hypothetical protein